MARIFFGEPETSRRFHAGFMVMLHLPVSGHETSSGFMALKPIRFHGLKPIQLHGLKPIGISILISESFKSRFKLRTIGSSVCP